MIGIVYLFLEPAHRKKKQLEKLGYHQNHIEVLMKEKKADEVIQKSIRSSVLKKAIDDHRFYPAYFTLYKPAIKTVLFKPKTFFYSNV